MATPNAYTKAQNGAVALAMRDLERVWRSLDLTDPYAAARALEAVWADLIATYGEVTATLAADRFEDLTGLPAVMVRPVDPERAEARMRWAVGPLFDGDGDAWGRLSGLVDELVKQPGRSTTIRSASEHGLRFARVPVGDTCRWCLMLASRGAVYASEDTAGKGRKFHGDCDCRVEPVASDADLERLRAEGYDPDALYEKYKAGTLGAPPPPPLEDMPEHELEARLEAAMAGGDWQEAERIGEILDSNFYTASGVRLDLSDPFRPDVYEWYEGLDQQTQARFHNSLTEMQQTYFDQEQWTYVTGRKARTRAPAGRVQREEYENHLEVEFVQAENYTNGFMLNTRAREAGHRPRDLWKVNEATARSWATEEMLDYWDSHPRYTWQDWQDLNAGDMDAITKRAGTWLQ